MRVLWIVAAVVVAGCTGVETPDRGDGEDTPAVACDVPLLGAPSTPAAVSGPGPGMATIRWDPVPGAVSYVVHRDGEAIPLGNSLAFGGHGDATYTVSAVNSCGDAGPESGAVEATALPGIEALQVGTAPLSSADGSQTRTWPVFDAEGRTTGNASWRVVTGTGNCCENYVITTESGRIIDFGGTFLHYSDDEGESWTTVGTPTPYVNGEGALVAAPQGDIVAVGWDPYSGDRLWAHKYVAADDQWYHQVMPLHQPFFDRAWTTVLKGPFEIDGMVAPYIVLVESNFHGGSNTVLLRSLDGLHYTSVSDAALTLPRESSGAVPDIGVDPDMDWIQPISQSPSRPLAPGFGLQQGSPDRGVLTSCDWRLVHEDGSVSCPGGVLADLPRNQPLLVDSQGNMHHFLMRSDGFDYRFLAAGTDTWHEQSIPMPEDASLRVHDQKVNAALDTAVVAVHVSQGDGTADYLYRFRNVTAEPRLTGIHQVGAADAGSDSGLGGDRRFDFMTVGMLPDGRAVLSFTDAEFHPPALAVEMPDA